MLRTSALLILIGLSACSPTQNDVDPGPPSRVVTEAFQAPGPVAGTLQYLRAATPKIAVVCIPGASYTGAGYYSGFAAKLVELNFAVLTIDPLGVGASAKPDGDKLGLQQQADVMATLIPAIKARGYSKIVTVCHSLGCPPVIIAAARGMGSDALAVTGFLHVPHQPPVPMQTIADLLSQGPYVDYLKQPGGSPMLRGSLMHSAGTSSQIIQADNAAAVPVPRQTLRDGLGLFSDGSPTNSTQVKSPVLTICAGADALYPCSLLPNETPYWQAPRTTFAAEGAGHAMFLESQGAGAMDKITAWMSQTFPGVN